MAKRLSITLAWLGILIMAAALRLPDLDHRPMHVDEATGAKILSVKLESGDYAFDPTHFHGPLLAQSTLPLAWMKGENRWQDLQKTTLRMQPVLAGLLLVLAPLLWVRWMGHGGALAGAALLATSPLLVYYNRMYIHESLFTLLAVIALAAFICWLERPTIGKAIVTGMLVGLMAATKESFSISMVAWAISLGGCLILLPSGTLAKGVRSRLPTAGIGLIAGILTALVCYTDGFRHPQGILDALRTVFVYQTGSGHDKPVWYYAHLLAWPKSSAGVLWWEGLVLIPAATAVLLASKAELRMRLIITFLGLAGIAHFAIYSLIAYKTPWLMMVPWVHFLLLAGFAIKAWGKVPWVKVSVMGAVILAAANGLHQSRIATTRLDNDARNPYAYSPTLRDVESLGSWLKQLDEVASESGIGPVAVIGEHYWPLPWYLRSLDSVGYWPQLQPSLCESTALIVMPDQAAAARSLLENTHVALPRGLRENVPIILYIENNIWKTWMNWEEP